ncbi:hypothetical protein WSK_1470 [Novosphingobium sp. Rr 2-17]|uniref:hypothetical protein n=1 Tax=Novosphingobium sp. Rr 2-17 TaxID=555793 RepID=UPI0002698EBE|nr:hypothetical protein [Novosphingobium sp. Rr 2-17]EIZ79932.1 hypothetical protein WSK_1470 [Novosphingobium sp. Rr 2-17]
MRLTQDRQIATASLRIGKAFKLKARADFSPLGLLAVGVLVSGILLGTSVIVATSRKRIG